MNETWFTSDTHFNHGKLMEFYQDRGKFSSVQEMNESMIQNWNSRIGPKDTVYHLGDFGSKWLNDDIAVLKRLNGIIFFVPGNHDRNFIKHRYAIHRLNLLPYSYQEISIDKQKIVLSHFPIWEWNGMHKGWWHLHGHLHGRPHNIPGKILDVGVDGHGLLPYNWSEVREYMEHREVRGRY